MICTTHPSLRPLAKVSTPDINSYDSLLSRALTDARILSDFVLAYASLETKNRYKMVEATAASAVSDRMDLTPIFVSLLSVESDSKIAKQLADTIYYTASRHIVSRINSYAMIAGDAEIGGVILVRSLYASFIEVLTLRWDSVHGITYDHFEPMENEGNVGRYTINLPINLSLRRSSLNDAIDPVTEALWRHRKIHGRLPACIVPFADLFCIDAT